MALKKSSLPAPNQRSLCRKIALPEFIKSIQLWSKALRAHQWVKNILLFIPLITAHQVNNIYLIEKLLIGFIAFSACASAGYIINDLADLKNDKQHPAKRRRAIAAQKISKKSGIKVTTILITSGILLAWNINHNFCYWLIIYTSLSACYSLHLKRYALIDCITLSELYTIRIIAGAYLTGIPLSFWLVAFSMFFFLSLAFIKRHVDIRAGALQGRGYHSDDGVLVQTMGLASGYASILILALYINSKSVIDLYKQPQIIWLAIPVITFWISRMWLKAHRNEMHHDPVIFAITDRGSQLVSLIVAAIFFSAFYIEWQW